MSGRTNHLLCGAAMCPAKNTPKLRDSYRYSWLALVEVVVHPLIRGLVDSLPPAGSDWTNEDCANWLQAAAFNFRLIYKGSGQSRSRPPTEAATRKAPPKRGKVGIVPKSGMRGYAPRRGY